MKKNSLILLTLLAAIPMTAQQRTVRQEQFPAPVPMVEENIEWQRDLYREIDLTDFPNAGLYCHREPREHHAGLFRTLFRLVLDNSIPAYRYDIEGNETFNDNTTVNAKDILKDFNIPYREKDGRIILNDDPATEVKMYYLKEGVYYDASNSCFRTRVLALCPVIVIDDEMDGEHMRFPMFWVEYRDLAPYLNGIEIIPDYRNKAEVIPMADYFTLNRYWGQIYMEDNGLGRPLSFYNHSDSTINARRTAICEEIRKTRRNTYNTFELSRVAKKRKTISFPWKRTKGKGKP